MSNPVAGRSERHPTARETHARTQECSHTMPSSFPARRIAERYDRFVPDASSIPHQSPACAMNTCNATTRNCLVSISRVRSQAVNYSHEPQAGVFAAHEWSVQTGNVNVHRDQQCGDKNTQGNCEC